MHLSFGSEYGYARGSVPKPKANKRFHACRHVADSPVWAVGLIVSTKGSSSLDSAGEASGGGGAGKAKKKKKKIGIPFF